MRRSLFFLFVALFIAPCSSEEDTYRITIVQRQALDPGAAAMLAEIPRAAGELDFVRALALCDSLERLAPQLADVPFERGRIYTKVGRLPDAEAAFEQVLALDPKYPGAWFELGNLAFRRQQYREAFAAFQNEEALLLELRRVAPEGVAVPPRGLPAARLQLGRAAEQLGDAAHAAAAYERVLEADSTFAEAYYELGRLREEEGDLEGALVFARRAYGFAPENSDNSYMLGSLLYRTGQAQASIPYLEQVVAERPWYAAGLYNLGQALVRTGRAQEAQPYLKQAEKMGQIQTQIDQARLTAEQYPGVVSHWLDLASLYMAAGRYEEAEQTLGTALRLEPEDPGLLNDLGNLYAMKGDYAAAASAFGGILARDSTQADVWLNLGVVYALSGNPEAARQAWERTLRYAPGHPEASANLARLK